MENVSCCKNTFFIYVFFYFKVNNFLFISIHYSHEYENKYYIHSVYFLINSIFFISGYDFNQFYVHLQHLNLTKYYYDCKFKIMGGGGFIADMIARINYNKDMLSKRSYLNKNKEIHYPTTKKKSNTTSLSEIEKQTQAKKINEYKTRNKRRNLLFFILSLLLTAVCICFLFNILRSLF